MARYRGPRMKIVRRLETPLPGLTRKVPRNAKREAQGGAKRKTSEYGRQLLEKQKVRYHYGVSETQLRRYFRAATASKGKVGEALLSLLERRLDNVVFRLGIAPTTPAARQLVSHGHMMVNGRRVNIASYLLRAGDAVSVRPKSRELPPLMRAMMERGNRVIPEYLQVDEEDPYTARMVRLPTRDDVPFIVDEATVVAFYSRRV
jgi:small subunit ribosomal protein S4